MYVPSMERHGLVRRKKSPLSGREFPFGVVLVWIVAELLFVLSAGLPYWAVYETLTSPFTGVGAGKLEVSHGVWQVCVTGVGSQCFDYSFIKNIDAEEFSDKHIGVQVAIGLGLFFSVMSGFSNLVWFVNATSSSPRTAVRATAAFNLLAGLSGVAAVILYGVVYQSHALQGWCLFVSILGSTFYIALCIAALYHYYTYMPPMTYVHGHGERMPTTKLPRLAPYHMYANGLKTMPYTGSTLSIWDRPQQAAWPVDYTGTYPPPSWQTASPYY